MSDLFDTAASIATVIGLPATLVGLVFVALEMRKNTATQRGEFFKELYEPFFLNDELRYTFQIIEYNQSIFAEDYGTIDPEESEKRQKAIENLFAHFEIICSFYKRGLIKDKDMQDFDYNIQRVFNHRGFHIYEAKLDKCWKDRGLKRGPYSTFFWYIDKKSKRLRLSKEGTPDYNKSRTSN